MAASALSIARGHRQFTEGYCVRQMRLDEDLSAVTSAWRQCNAAFQNDTIYCDPEWLRELYKGDGTEVRLLLFEKDDKVVGAVPFAFMNTTLKCQLGDVTAATFSVRRLHLFGYSPSIPAERAAHDALFGQFQDLASNYDVIFMESLRADSFFWRYLHSSPLVRKSFRLCCPHGPLPRPIVRMREYYSDYLCKFSSKTRKNRLREVKKLRERGKVELVRVTEAPQVDSFVDTVAEISRKTYQFNVLGTGIREAHTWKERLRFAAQNGWLRSYLLKCGATPCSFLIGYQFRRTYVHYNIGFDPAWSDFSVGTVLQLLALEDLFDHNKPEIYDFGAYAGYKSYFSNDSYAEAMVFLFPRRAYPLMVESVYRACTVTSNLAGILLERLNLKSRIKRLIRGHG